MLGSSLISDRSISSIFAPAARSNVRLRSKAKDTVLSRLSCIKVRATAKRQSVIGLSCKFTFRAAKTSCTVIASRTERVNAHTVSKLVDKGRAPCVGTSLAVLLKPTIPHSAAGMRIEPPVSEPRPTKAAPAATDTAAPDDEPPGMRSTWVSAGLTGVP